METTKNQITSLAKKLYSNKLIIGIVIIFILILFTLISQSKNNSQPNIAVNNTNSTSLSKNVPINRTFTFPIVNQQNQNVGTLKYTIQSAELENQIIIKGQQATAADGRTFLIVNLKIVNDTNNDFQINSRDFVRLAIDNNTKEWFAADIHNDPVEIQPISTKYTRIAFPVNNGIKHFKLQIGEITGKKTIVDLNFK